MFAATAGPSKVLDPADRPVASLQGLVQHAFDWAYRRAREDRWCVHAPFTLATETAVVHAELAVRAQRDPEAARLAERRAQYASLLDVVGTDGG